MVVIYYLTVSGNGCDPITSYYSEYDKMKKDAKNAICLDYQIEHGTIDLVDLCYNQAYDNECGKCVDNECGKCVYLCNNSYKVEPVNNSMIYEEFFEDEKEATRGMIFEETNTDQIIEIKDESLEYLDTLW